MIKYIINNNKKLKINELEKRKCEYSSERAQLIIKNIQTKNIYRLFDLFSMTTPNTALYIL